MNNVFIKIPVNKKTKSLNSSEPTSRTYGAEPTSRTYGAEEKQKPLRITVPLKNLPDIEANFLDQEESDPILTSSTIKLPECKPLSPDEVVEIFSDLWYSSNVRPFNVKFDQEIFSEWVCEDEKEEEVFTVSGIFPKTLEEKDLVYAIEVITEDVVEEYEMLKEYNSISEVKQKESYLYYEDLIAGDWNTKYLIQKHIQEKHSIPVIWKNETLVVRAPEN